MSNYIFRWCLLLACVIPAGTAGSQVKDSQPACVSFNYNDLIAIRKSIEAGEARYKAPYNRLLTIAGKLLNKTPDNVTNGDMPPTGDKHDFYTIGKFSWPNPNTPDSMPYIRGDGKYNQEAFGDRYDLTRLQTTVSNINTLTLAWFYTGDEKYSAKAAELLNTWFINPATRMNPNMECASALPGVYNGMAVGIIFTVVLIEMTDHVQMLRLSKSWDRASDQSLQKWFTDYRHWLETSKFGREEKAAANNHGTWYAAQLLAYKLFTGSKEDVSVQFEEAKEKIGVQIMADGRLPLEMKRVEGFHYFIYGLRAFNVLANGLNQSGYDLWSYKTAEGKSIQLPYQFILPYINGNKQWTTGGVTDVNNAEVIIMLKQAASVYNLPETKNAIKQLKAGMKPEDIKQLYFYE